MTDGEEHPCQYSGQLLSEGDEVIFNDRERALFVVGTHERENTSKTRVHRGVGKYHTIVRLEGNGTEYHLLCTPGSQHGPMLYTEADWDADKTDELGQSPRYSRMGERVESMSVSHD